MSDRIETNQVGTRQSDVELSKFLSMILRHRPQAIGITLDEHGWANVDTSCSPG